MKQTFLQKNTHTHTNEYLRILFDILKTNYFKMKKVFLILCLTFCYLVTFSQKNEIFIDTRDGQHYKAVEIGKYIWMAENLRYNSDSSYFWLDDSLNIKYGKLYNVQILKTVCPSGWHLPTGKEFLDLNDNIKAANSFNTVTIDYSGKFFDENGFNVVKLPNKKGKLNHPMISFFGLNESMLLLENPNLVWGFLLSKPYNKWKHLDTTGFVRCVKDY